MPARLPGPGGVLLRDWRLAALTWAYVVGVGRGLYDPVRKLESARLYGDITHYAYYYVDLTVGTPPQRVSVILDTGSGLLAFPCAGCPHCGKHIDPLFDISKSTSAKWVPCGGSNRCRGSCTAGHCSYRQSYLEGSAISGYWFEDFVRLGDTIQHNPPIKAMMGCHQNENKLFYTQKANGIFGIQGSQTLLNDLFADSGHVNSRIFAICLATEGGRLTVGGSNSSYHKGVVKYTRQVGGGYGVKLNEVRIAGRVINGFRSTMIDSGTTYTFFNRNQYKVMRQYVEDYCKTGKCKATRANDCWTAGDEGIQHFPSMDFHFDSVTITWNPREYFYKVGTSKYCYSFKDDGMRTMTTLGATWMLYKEVIFDLAAHQIGMVAADCPEYKVRPTHTIEAAQAEPQAPAARPPAPASGSGSGAPKAATALPTMAPTKPAPQATQPPAQSTGPRAAPAPLPLATPAPAPLPSQLPRAWNSAQAVPWKKPGDERDVPAGKPANKTEAAAKLRRRREKRDLALKIFAIVGFVFVLAMLAGFCRRSGSDGAPEEREHITTQEAPAPMAEVVGRPESEEAGRGAAQGVGADERQTVETSQDVGEQRSMMK